MSNPCPDCGRSLLGGRVCIDCPFSCWPLEGPRRLESPLTWSGPLTLRGRRLLRLYYNTARLRSGSHPESHKFRNTPPEVFDRLVTIEAFKITTRS